MKSFICMFCGNAKSSNRVRASHQTLCKENPNKKQTPFQNGHFQSTKKIGNQYISGQQKSPSDETKEKIRQKAKGRKHSDETKEKLSQYAKNRNFGGVTQSRRIEYNGVKLGSSYELILAKSLDENNICWIQPERLKYKDNLGKSRTYTADFYLPEYDVFLDPKNDFLIENINPSLGFSDIEKIDWVSKQNSVKIYVLNKYQLDWQIVKLLLTPRKRGPGFVTR